MIKRDEGHDFEINLLADFDRRQRVTRLLIPVMLVTGMTSRVRAAKYYPERVDPWTASILDKKPTRLATVAMANKTACIVWAVLSRGEPYKQPIAA